MTPITVKNNLRIVPGNRFSNVSKILAKKYPIEYINTVTIITIDIRSKNGKSFGVIVTSQRET